LEHSYLHRLSRLLWGVMVTLIVVLAMYVSFGRLLMSNVEEYDRQILQEINARLPFVIEADKVGGEWHFFSPELVFSALRITIPGSTEPPIELDGGRVTLDVLESLQTRSLQISKLALNALSLKGELSEEGKFSITGFGNGNADIGEWLEEFLLNIESVDLTDNRLALGLPNKQLRQLQLDLALRRTGSSRLLEAKIFSQTSGTRISLVAEGVGNPMSRDTFVGELYLNVDMSDLSAFQQLLNRPSAVDIKGDLQAELWLGWDRGNPTVAFNLHGLDMEFGATDQSWKLPADEISMQANLVERKGHWTVFVSDFEFYKDDIQLRLPRLQLDTWGDSFRLQAEAVPLVPVNALLVDLSLTPEAIADVFQVLNTRGELSSLQLDIADLGAPADDWEFIANFHEIEVDAWRGAPSITSAKGYVALERSGGYVILDSQSFAMGFPTVYEQPLKYDDVYGTINIDWDAHDLKLSSGLLSLTGEEGVGHVLFGLNIPLVVSNVGLEMDLLVGMEDFDPRYRSKYLPYILSEPLLDWLQPSIEAGRIVEGAFLWRGNLRSNTPDLKTIQLFFNIADTRLNYHMDWPPVSAVEGTVFIDDTSVSVWAESATLYNSDILYLSAETWVNEENRMVLAIGGSLEGAAGDGLKIVNNSPISNIVGPVFKDWVVTGQLHTDLQLQLVLSGSTQPPDIDVKTLWQDVDLKVMPGNITVSDINGVFSYNSEQGFSSQDLKGELWGRPLAAQIIQDESGAVEVALATRVDMADIRQWLDLDILALAKGETEADIRIRVVPQEGAVLLVDSELLGVELDLPEPWGKTAQQTAPLHVKFPLGGDVGPMQLELLSDLRFHLQLSEGRLTGASLGFYQSPGEIDAGILRISGHSPLINTDQWQRFISTYIEDELLTSIEAGGGMSVEIDELGTDTLVLFGQDLRDVVFTLENKSGSWHIFAETDWFSGTLQLVAEGESTSLAVQYLELEKLEQLNLSAPGDGDLLELPDMAVSLKGLHKDAKPIGELEFSLRNDGSTLIAENIVGNIVGLTIDEQNPASLSWIQGEQDSKTSLNALFKFTDLGATLEQLGYQKILETQNGQFDLDLQWPGGPQSFALQDAQGSLNIDLGEGTFLSAPAGASGALRVINILNLAEIIGRLSLTHMFKSGIPFHSVDGEVFLQGGSIEVVDLEVEGSTSGFQFNGVADILSESLEGNLVVTLPVANNLPWIVALTAGLPIAAGVFVVSKVFQKQVNRFTSGVYRVSGSWDDPQVNFARIFDDSSAASIRSEIEAAARRLEDPNTPLELIQTIDPNDVPVQLSPEDAS